MSRSIRTGIAAAAIAGLALTGCTARASDVPAFEDIEQDMWEAMESSEAVAITGLNPESVVTESDASMIGDVMGGDFSDLQVYGAMDGSATAISTGEGEAPIMSVFGEDVYVSMDMLFESLGDTMMAGASEEQRAQFDQLATTFEGSYLNVAEELEIDTDTVETIQINDLLAEMRAAAEADRADEVTGFNFGDLQSEGSYQQLELEGDATGWYYSIHGVDEDGFMKDDSTEFIAVVTDREAPRLDHIRSGNTKMEFRWDDEVDLPQPPSEDQLVTEADFMEASLGL
jgi:hypothetical protein